MQTNYQEITEYNIRQLGLDTKSRKSQVNIYSDSTHFIFEILQNADDYGATEITFKLDKHQLTIIHNGIPFTTANVKAVTYFGASTSEPDLVKTGRFGIGFKSVFTFTASPIIISGEESFKIYDLYKIESYKSSESKSPKETHIILPFNHHDVRPDFVDELLSAQEAYGRIESKLHSLDMLTLLFTKNLKKIQWQTTGQNGEYIRSDVRNKNYRITTISAKGKQSSFFVFSKDIVWELNSYKPVDIALQINKNGEFVPVSRSLFVLFPTILDTRLKFILNGPFRTKPSRESISYDDKFNQNIISTACQLFQDILIILKNEGRIDDKFLNLLPIGSDEVIDFFIPLHNTINTIFKTEPYIPTNNQKYNTLENIRYVSPKRLSDFFSREDIVVLEENSNIEVLMPISKNSRAFEFLSSLGLIDWSWKELEDNLSTLFKGKVYIDKLEDQDLNKDAYQWILSKSDDWLIQFYTLLSEGVEGGKIGTEDFNYSTYDSERKLSSVFIIKCEEFNDFYFDDAPSTKFPKDGYTCVLFNGFLEKAEDEIPKIKNVFQSLGVKDLSESDEITILLRENYDTIYSTSSSKNIALTDHLEHLQKFKNFYKNNKRTTIFQNYKFLLTENLLFTSPSLVFVDNNFLSTGLSILFSLEREIYSKKFRIWNGYEEIFDEDLLKFWEELGVYTSLKIVSQVIYMNPRWNDLRAGMYGNDGSPYKVEKDYVIPNLEKILLSNNLEVIKLLWTTMDCLDSDFFTAKYRINSNYRIKEVPSYLIHILSSHDWIPTADLEYKHPHDITFEELHGELKILTKNIEWLDKIELGKNKRKEIEQYNQKKEILDEFIDPDDYSSYLEFKKISGNKPLSFVVDLFRPSQLLPERPVSNHEKRKEIVQTKFKEAEAINFDNEIRNTRVTKSKLDKVIKNYLRGYYTNVNNKMICQICLDVMPFKVNGQYYFEHIEIFKSDFIGQEVEFPYLALCPNCAAKYKYLVKSDDKKLLDIKNAIIAMTEDEQQIIYIGLGDERIELFFTQAHIFDLQCILK